MNCQKNNIITSDLLVNVLLGIIIVLSSCSNHQKHLIFLNKEVEIEITCDSINLASEVSFFSLYFHVSNYSKNDVFFSFNNEEDTLSKKSLIFITSKNDTIPIWYPQIDLGIKMFKKESVTYFMGMVERQKFSVNYNSYGGNIGSLEYFKNQLPFSKIIYVPDQIKFTKSVFPNCDTVVSIKGSIVVDKRNIKVVYRGDTQSDNDSFKFRTRKLKT